MTCKDCQNREELLAEAAKETYLPRKFALEQMETMQTLEAVDRQTKGGKLPCKGCIERAALLIEAVKAARGGKMSEANKKMWQMLKSAGKDAMAAAFRNQFDPDEEPPKS